MHENFTAERNFKQNLFMQHIKSKYSRHISFFKIFVAACKFSHAPFQILRAIKILSSWFKFIQLTVFLLCPWRLWYATELFPLVKKIEQSLSRFLSFWKKNENFRKIYWIKMDAQNWCYLIETLFIHHNTNFARLWSVISSNFFLSVNRSQIAGTT